MDGTSVSRVAAEHMHSRWRKNHTALIVGEVVRQGRAHYGGADAIIDVFAPLVLTASLPDLASCGLVERIKVVNEYAGTIQAALKASVGKSFSQPLRDSFCRHNRR